MSKVIQPQLGRQAFGVAFLLGALRISYPLLALAIARVMTECDQLQQTWNILVAM